jgi:hypothetical protein
MKKTTQIKEIQKRLPDDIIIEDLSKIEEFTEDEFLVILGWIDAFNNHYRRYGKNVEETFYPHCVFVSTRLFIDFYFYNKKDNRGEAAKEYLIYLESVTEGSKAHRRKKFVNDWNL